MRTAAIFAAAIAFVAPVLAQSDAASVLSSLPTCGQTCILSGISATGCSPTDSACLCSNTAYQSGVASCVTSSCSSKDAAKVAAAASSLCPNGTGAQAAGGSSAASSAAPSSSAASSSAAAKMSSSSAAAATGSSSMMMASSMAGSATSAAGSATSSHPAVYTGAASNVGTGLGFLAMLGVAAAL